MKPKIKADVTSVRTLNPNDYFSGNQKALTVFNFRKNKPLGQCRKCKSDYLKYAIDNLCQDCLQYEEFRFRECRHTFNKFRHKGGNHK